jgi:hypothetical protein
MIASVHVLHASPPEISGFLRVGHTGHRKLTRSSMPMFRGKLQNLNSVAGGQKK